MIKQWLSIILLGFITSLAGCVSYSEHQLPQVAGWPPAAVPAQRSIYLKLTSLHLYNEAPSSGGAVPGWEKALTDAYRASGRFQQVNTQQVASDVYADVTLTNHEQGNNAMAFISGFTLTVIPCTFSNTLTLETIYKDQNGKVLGKVQKSETITTWVQLLLVFGAPFNQSVESILKQLSESSIQEAIQQKLI